MRLSTAERLAEVLHVTLGTFATALRRKTYEIVERRPLMQAAELARLQAE